MPKSGKSDIPWCTCGALPLPHVHCLRCGHFWSPRTPEILACANQACRSIYWRRPKKESNNKNKGKKI